MILIVMPKKKQISMFLGFVIYITNIVNQSFDINFQKSANTIVMKKIGQKC